MAFGGQIDGRQIKEDTLPASNVSNDSGVTGADVAAALDQLDTDQSAHEARTDNPHAVTATQVGAIPTSQKGAANGVATLDADGKIPQAQIPAVALERMTTVADEPARFALTSTQVQEGDIVKQADSGVSYVVTDVNNLDNAGGYTMIVAPSASAVDSVFGRVGAVGAQAGDYSASQITNDSTVNGANVDDALEQLGSDLGAHTGDSGNPHGVTAGQIGAYTSAEVNSLLGNAGNIGNGDVSNMELSYLNGVTSGVQSQLDTANRAHLDPVPNGTVNGVNVDFALESGAVGVACDPETLDVFLNNLWQDPDNVPTPDYTLISGNTIIRFATAPLNGWRVRVRGRVAP